MTADLKGFRSLADLWRVGRAPILDEIAGSRGIADDRGGGVTIRTVLWKQIVNAAGCCCLAISLLLLPLGVNTVRAEDGSEALMSVDPALSASPSETARPAAVAPSTQLGGTDEVDRPGAPGVEIQPDVIQLNTRGYNYGPDPAELDPSALGHEARTR